MSNKNLVAITTLTAISVSVMLSAQSAQALISTFTDMDDWADAAGGSVIMLEDFNSLPTGSIPGTLNTGPLTLTENNFASARIFSNPFTTIDGSNHLNAVLLFAADRTLDMAFNDGPLYALGFDWKNTDASRDVANLTVGVNGFDFGIPTSAGGPGEGFFGIVSDTPFSSVEFKDTPGGGGILGSLSIDNVKTVTVPEPVSLLGLLAIGALGATSLKRKENEEA